MTSDRLNVVALGAVDPALVNGVLGRGISFLAEPSADDLAVAVGAVARADAVVDNALFEQALAEAFGMRSVEPGATFPAGQPHHFFMDRFAAAFRSELAAFTQVVARQRQSPCTVADAVETAWVAELCTTSLREHRPVQLEEVRG
jgi:predicted dehydrogenase